MWRGWESPTCACRTGYTRECPHPHPFSPGLRCTRVVHVCRACVCARWKVPEVTHTHTHVLFADAWVLLQLHERQSTVDGHGAASLHSRAQGPRHGRTRRRSGVGHAHHPPRCRHQRFRYLGGRNSGAWCVPTTPVPRPPPACLVPMATTLSGASLTTGSLCWPRPHVHEHWQRHRCHGAAVA